MIKSRNSKQISQSEWCTRPGWVLSWATTFANKHCKSWIPNPISWHCNCIFVEFFPLCLWKLLNYWKKSNLIQVNAAKRKLFKKNMLRRHFVEVSVLIVKSTSATHKIIFISKYFKPYLSSQLNHRMRLHTRHLKCFVL